MKARWKLARRSSHGSMVELAPPINRHVPSTRLDDVVESGLAEAMHSPVDPKSIAPLGPSAQRSSALRPGSTASAGRCPAATDSTVTRLSASRNSRSKPIVQCISARRALPHSVRSSMGRAAERPPANHQLHGEDIHEGIETSARSPLRLRLCGSCFGALDGQRSSPTVGRTRRCRGLPNIVLRGRRSARCA